MVTEIETYTYSDQEERDLDRLTDSGMSYDDARRRLGILASGTMTLSKDFPDQEAITTHTGELSVQDLRALGYADEVIHAQGGIGALSAREENGRIEPDLHGIPFVR